MASQAKILIVDDDTMMGVSTRRVLESYGYKTFLAETGQAAFNLMREEKFDLALLDINMPDMSGFEICQRMKADPQMVGVAVIILSGGMIQSDDKVTGINLGADDYITRPVPNRELLARIQAALRVKAAEHTLRNSEMQLQVLISANIDGMLVLDPQGRVQLVNAAACQLLGRLQVELVGATLDLPVGQGQDAEFEIKLADGSVRTLDLRSTTIQWQAANASLVSMRDITARKQAENQLRESKEHFRLLTENIRDVVWTMDAETLRFLYVGPSVFNLRGFTPEEIIAQPLDAALSPEAAAFVRGKMSSDMAGFLAGKFGRDHFFVNEVDQPCKDGSIVWTEVITSYYKNEKTGRVEILGVTRDITERRRMENELRASDKRFGDTLDAVKDGIWDWQVQSGEIFVSKNLYVILGYSGQEFAVNYVTWQALVHPEDIQTTEEILKHGIESGEAFNIDLRMRMKAGAWRWFSMRGRAVERQADGRVARILGTLSDISARKQAEDELREAHMQLEQRVEERTAELKVAYDELEKAGHLKDEFLSSISHELRTPLTGILGLSQVLQLQTYGELSEKQMAALHNIEESGRHLLEMINDILDYSRIEAGKMDLQITQCSLVEVCQTSLQAIRALAGTKQQQVSFTTDPATLIVRGDVRRLKQSLVKLLGNAIKFTPNGGSLGIELNGSEIPGQVRITVWDKGIGIHPGDFQRLFQPFTQLDARLERRYGGSGLGLSLVRRFSELQGGRVTVESVHGAGSRFSIILPRT